MKRPVTSLCRRPGKKDRLRGSLSPMREQFPPTGTLCGGQAELPGKSRPDEGAKTVPARAGDCVQAAPIGGTAGDRACLVPGRHRTGHPPGQRACPGAKTAPGGGRRLSGCGIWVLLAPGDPCDLDAQGGQHSQAEDHAQLSQGEICHQEQAMQNGDQQHSQEQQHAHAEGSQ